MRNDAYCHNSKNAENLTKTVYLLSFNNTLLH